jgi:hypothetical protein
VPRECSLRIAARADIEDTLLGHVRNVRPDRRYLAAVAIRHRVNQTKMHRVLKWLWICPGIPVSFILRESVPWLVFMSAYAIIVGHWSAEEAAEGD